MNNAFVLHDTRSLTKNGLLRFDDPAEWELWQTAEFTWGGMLQRLDVRQVRHDAGMGVL